MKDLVDETIAFLSVDVQRRSGIFGWSVLIDPRQRSVTSIRFFSSDQSETNSTRIETKICELLNSVLQIRERQSSSNLFKEVVTLIEKFPLHV